MMTKTLTCSAIRRFDANPNLTAVTSAASKEVAAQCDHTGQLWCNFRPARNPAKSVRATAVGGGNSPELRISTRRFSSLFPYGQFSFLGD
jgi:hypothetical protein